MEGPGSGSLPGWIGRTRCPAGEAGLAAIRPRLSRPRVASRAGDVDVGQVEVEEDVAAMAGALGQGRRAVAGPARGGGRPAAGRAVDDQPQGDGPRVDGGGLELEAEAADGACGLAGAGGDGAIELGLGHRWPPGRSWRTATR